MRAGKTAAELHMTSQAALTSPMLFAQCSEGGGGSTWSDAPHMTMVEQRTQRIRPPTPHRTSDALHDAILYQLKRRG